MQRVIIILQKALKVKIYKNHYTAIACLALLLSCNGAQGALVQGDNPDQIYIRAYSPSRNQHPESKRAAKARAEMAAIQEFIIYALRENLALPDPLKRLENKIKQVLLSEQTVVRLIGARVLRSDILPDGRASCLMAIPKSNLQFFKSFDFSRNPQEILKILPHSSLLKFEISLELQQANASLPVNANSPLARAVAKKPLLAISPLWLKTIPAEASLLQQLSDAELLQLLEGTLASDDIQLMLIAELKRRSYTKSALYVKGIVLPRREPLIDYSIFMDDLEPERFNNSPLVKIMATHGCAISFANTDPNNEKYKEALKIFSSVEPEFVDIKALLEDSLIEGVCDDALNLLGRCYEEEGRYAEALVCFLQAHTINPCQEYVKYNIANVFYSLGKEEHALFWAQETQKYHSSSPWVKNRAQLLIERIHLRAAK